MITNFQIREPIVCDALQENTVAFSPDCRFIATLSSESEIQVRDCITLNVIRKIECQGSINSFFWSPDSKLLLVLMKSLNSIQIYFVEQATNNQNRITSSYAGISGGTIDTESVMWSPDSSAVLLFGAHASSLCIWDITNRSIRRLPPPKNTFASAAYSPDGRYLAILTHNNGKDILAIIDSQSLKKKMNFVLSTLDSTTVKWTANSQNVYVIDSISHHLLQIINIQTQAIFDHSAYDGFLGITEAVACNNSKIIAVGGFDDYVRLLVQSDNKWRILTEMLHETSFTHHQSISLFVENGNAFEQRDSSNASLQKTGDKGIKSIKWAPGDKLLASISSQTPSALFIWNEEIISLVAVIVFIGPIKKFEWSPINESLLIASDSGFITLWTPNGVPSMISSVDLMRVQDFYWRSDGKAFLIVDKNAGTAALAV